MTNHHRLSAAVTVAITLVFAGCGSDEPETAATTPATDAPVQTGATSPATTDTTDASAGSCGQTTAPPEQTVTFTFSHTDDAQGVDSDSGSSFAHVTGLVVVTPDDNTEPLSVTVSVLDGPEIAAFDDLAPGSTCGIDHDFAPGDYFVRSSDGNGTQFTSFADEPSATGATTTDPSPRSATVEFDGTTYDFTNGGCSDEIDADQFLFRDPPEPGIDATYMAITVTDVTEPTTTGGEHAGAITVQQAGSIVLSVSDATIVIDDDLGGGTFSGPDFLTGKDVTGSYRC